MALTPQQIAQMKAAREEKLKSLSSLSRKSSAVSGANATDSVKKEELVAYKINLRISDREYMRDYVYTMTQRLGRLYTMTEALEDAVKSLRENTNFNITKSPKKTKTR